MTPEEAAEWAAQRERSRRAYELMERRLKRDAELAAARGPGDEGPPFLPPMSADELMTEKAMRERTRYFRELMAWRLKRDAELAAASEQQQPNP